MAETLERALAPLLIIGSFCNLYMIEYPRGQPRIYLSYLYALAKWGSLTYFIYYPAYVRYLQKEIKLMSDFLPLFSFTLILNCFSRFKDLKMCLRKLAIVDDTLEAVEAPKEYQRLRNWIIQMLRICDDDRAAILQHQLICQDKVEQEFPDSNQNKFYNLTLHLGKHVSLFVLPTIVFWRSLITPSVCSNDPRKIQSPPLHNTSGNTPRRPRSVHAGLATIFPECQLRRDAMTPVPLDSANVDPTIWVKKLNPFDLRLDLVRSQVFEGNECE
ncbi:hypothetical protein G5I_04167 [Acromyrmex echinatior]|uniref:Uncharacterized protein n=1 Tax=Acromyrmex echinatior TaxID=103372 RepID=F4WEW6_ACREC|nr:hypothetical protein G5I_04167 [Acromyrmex echinatior]